jgi:hypothetical protein
MKGTYRTLIWLLSTFLLLGAYGCRDRKEEAKDVAPVHYVTATGKGEYRVDSSLDPPPRVSIDTNPRDSTGTEAIIKVHVTDKTGIDAGISEVVVYQDCDEIARLKPKKWDLRDFYDEIHVKNLEEGEHFFLAAGTDLGKQTSYDETYLYSSGRVNDQPPRVQEFNLTGDGWFNLRIYDPPENAGIVKATVFEINGDDIKPLYSWDYPHFSGAKYPLPDGRSGTREYFLQLEDRGNNVTESEKLKVLFK